ncbi:conserved hypothetical protein [Ricinus communis]|uniref:Uncharacterized protein n=1 Tax=Ricinus communis TaxID=3988 RepID=B9SHW8_RICCO|nr:conserved hypothetical protein [Ricinus communis]
MSDITRGLRRLSYQPERMSVEEATTGKKRKGEASKSENPVSSINEKRKGKKTKA